MLLVFGSPGFAATGSGIIVRVEAPMTIPAELRQAIERAGNEPVRIEDPEIRGTYVLLRADVYERMRALMEAEEIDPSFFEIDDFEPAREDPWSLSGTAFFRPGGARVNSQGREPLEERRANKKDI
jgi:hypothetical protein